MTIKNIIPLIILNWNGEDDTIACLKSIKLSENQSFLPIIVDNGSESTSLGKLRNYCKISYPSFINLNKEDINSLKDNITDIISNSAINDIIIFIENNENLGFARGNNVGISLAQIIGSKWVMLLNNDTEVESKTFSELLNFIDKNSEYYAVTPEIRYHYNKELIWNCGGALTHFGSRKYLFAKQSNPLRPLNGFSPITFITGCALLFRVDKIGPLTEDFFFGEEDYEFSLRMKKNGLKMACVHKSLIYHKVGASIKKNSNVVGQIYIYYINRLISTRKYYSNLRWYSTKFVSFTYLPVLLIKHKISPIKAIGLALKINSYVNKNKQVDKREFLSILTPR